MSFKVTFATPPAFNAIFSGGENLKAEFGTVIEIPVTDYYEGEYNITPTTQEQIVPIIGLTARRNITVGAIPSNYGLITWNGSTLTVS